MVTISEAAKAAITATVQHFKESGLDDYAGVERGRSGELSLLLEPQSEAELAALINALGEHKIPTVTIAGQSGLVEAQRPEGVAISMKRFNSIGAFDAEKGTLTVGAGVAIDTINEFLAEKGFKLPIVMGSMASASAGACAANGSAGANAIRYGTAADMALNVRGVLGTGDIVEQAITPRPPVTDPEACLIRSDRFSHGDSLVGSQGTFGLITEVTYKVFPLERDQSIVMLPLQDVATATHLLEQLQAQFNQENTAIELFEIIKQDTLDRAQKHAELSLRDAVAEAPYYVMVQVTSNQAPQPSEMLDSDFTALDDELVGFLMGRATGKDDEILFEDGGFDFDHNPTRLLHLREACSEMSRTLPKQAYDVVVPLKYLDDFVAELEQALAERYPEFTLSVFGHGGVGALHIHTIAPDKEALEANRAEMDTMVFDIVQKYNGSPWAEHGVGRKWGHEWIRRTPDDVRAEIADIKERNDPNNVLGFGIMGLDDLARVREGFPKENGKDVDGTANGPVVVPRK